MKSQHTAEAESQTPYCYNGFRKRETVSHEIRRIRFPAFKEKFHKNTEESRDREKRQK